MLAVGSLSKMIFNASILKRIYQVKNYLPPKNSNEQDIDFDKLLAADTEFKTERNKSLTQAVISRDKHSLTGSSKAINSIADRKSLKSPQSNIQDGLFSNLNIVQDCSQIQNNKIFEAFDRRFNYCVYDNHLAIDRGQNTQKNLTSQSTLNQNHEQENNRFQEVVLTQLKKKSKNIEQSESKRETIDKINAILLPKNSNFEKVTDFKLKKNSKGFSDLDLQKDQAHSHQGYQLQKRKKTDTQIKLREAPSNRANVNEIDFSSLVKRSRSKSQQIKRHHIFQGLEDVRGKSILAANSKGLPSLNNFDFQQKVRKEKIIQSEDITQILMDMISRGRFKYSGKEILQVILKCLCLKKKERLRFDEDNKQHYLFRKATDKLEQELDVITLLRSLRKVRLMNSALLNQKSRMLLRFQRKNVIESSSSSSDSDDNQAEVLRLMENQNPMLRLIIYGKLKKMMMSYANHKLQRIDRNLIRGIYLRKIKDFKEDQLEKNKCIYLQFKEYQSITVQQANWKELQLESEEK